MSFYDINPENLPKNAQYFHNVLIVLVGISPFLWKYEDYEEIWHLEQITSPRPVAYCFYPNPELQEQQEGDIGFEIILVNHCVVEVCGDVVTWYDGTDDEGEDTEEQDFDLRDSWRL